MDKHEAMKKKKAKRRLKRTSKRNSTGDDYEYFITEKGKAALIEMGFEEDDFKKVQEGDNGI